MITEGEFMILKASQANLEEAKQVYEDHIAKLNRMIEDLQKTLMVERCAASGYIHQIAAMEVEHKDSKYLKPTAMKNADGSVKTIGRAIFDIYFDRKAKEIGLKNPEKYRG